MSSFNAIAWQTVAHLIGKETFKAVLNSTGVIFFSKAQRHCDTKADGISFEDEGGNALAVLIMPNKIEIRSHRDFSPERVKELLKRLHGVDELKRLAGLKATYRGEVIWQGGGG
jgi:hypothetical protein